MRKVPAVIAATLSAAICFMQGIFISAHSASHASVRLHEQAATSVAFAAFTGELSGMQSANRAINSAEQSRWSGIKNACLEVKVGDQVVAAQNLSTPYSPASGLKLLIASAALGTLGADAHLHTVVKGAKPTAGNVAGNIYVIGGGDPLISTDLYAARAPQDSQNHTSLDQMARTLKAAGVTHVSGSIVVDDSRYDDVRVNPKWSSEFVPKQVSPIGPLVLNDNHKDDTTAIADDPAVVFGNGFKAALLAQGVSVDGDSHVGATPSSAIQLMDQESLPLSVIVGDMLRNSNNTTAEMLVKELAIANKQGGTTTNGLLDLRAWLEKNRFDLTGYEQVDGSGLASENRVTCNLLLQLLERDTGHLRENLAVAGQDGTLRDRLKGSAAAAVIHAKTGTLQNASSLSGYVDTKGGPPVMFAAIGNGFGNATEARAWQDDYANALSTFSTQYAASLATQ